MKRPIEPVDIRKGDLIRSERDGDAIYSAVEYVAAYDGHDSGDGPHYLLDRPTPPVQLPEKPTLGWLTVGEDDVRIGKWAVSGLAARNHLDNGTALQWVTAFVPATAVPTAALDVFRHLRETRNLTNGHIDNLLAAVDAAGSQS